MEQKNQKLDRALRIHKWQRRILPIILALGMFGAIGAYFVLSAPDERLLH